MSQSLDTGLPPRRNARDGPRGLAERRAPPTQVSVLELACFAATSGNCRKRGVRDFRSGGPSHLPPSPAPPPRLGGAARVRGYCFRGAGDGTAATLPSVTLSARRRGRFSAFGWGDSFLVFLRWSPPL